MRYLFLVLLFVGCTKALTDSDRTFEGIHEVPAMSKDQIYNATKIWIAETFRSAKAVIEYDNKEDGTLIGNGTINYPSKGFDSLVSSGWKVTFTMRVDVKDNKFKITFSNIGLIVPGQASHGVSPYNGPVHQKSDIDKIRPKLLAFGNELVIAIQKGGSKKDF